MNHYSVLLSHLRKEIQAIATLQFLQPLQILANSLRYHFSRNINQNNSIRYETDKKDMFVPGTPGIWVQLYKCISESHYSYQDVER